MNAQISVPMLLGLVLCLLVPAAAVPVLDDAAQKKIDDICSTSISTHKCPGCCIVIGTKDKVLFAKAYGHFTYDPSSPAVTLDSPFDMASCSKPIGTGTALALLLEDGKVKLDDPVSKYLKAWDRDDKRTITIRNLATHTSGLPSYTSASRAEKGRKPGETSADAMINCIASLPLQYKTNEGQLYACLNYLTLARVNEEIAKTNQETLLRKRIWDPLGMTHTGYYLTDDQKKLCVPTLKNRQGEAHDPLAYYYRDGYHCSGNAGLFTTGNDLAKFCQMILSDGKVGKKRVFKPETVDMFFTNQSPAKDTWGLGWDIPKDRPYPEGMVVGPKTANLSHTGYTGTMVEVDRYAGTYFITLTNRVYPDDNTDVIEIRRGVRHAVIDNDPLYKKKEAAATPAPTPAPAPAKP